MKITEFELVCPYPGLRSFSEDESVYFKGRDLQIDQVCDLLQQNKFLMLTGASGEGKSSLIYAGLIPNAKAGFFKAQFTNWIVADFRPERTPLLNMADAISTALSITKETAETELNRGYSSLIDLYTNSDYYTDENDFPFSILSESEKKEKKRKSANLLVIIDQFEEFFTNPENFFQEAPSRDSQVVVNLALETARIALKRNLPVYVVCTMRSDFIGQCVAFRGLPEYIGFSQFFVPRLKRKDFKLVVEEPAVLSGNRISQRLIERLVYDLAEGIDQLPVLQHALSQVWLAADKGAEELDLIHYAMVGGIPADELPDNDREKFISWLDAQPDYKKKFFSECGLHKIIEFHANTLYEEAWEQYMLLHPEKPITIRTAKRIIGMTFACLTKIDNSRAVRNRMTIQEITNILNDSEITCDMVANVLAIFRLESNSFIRPYITADPSTAQLSPDSVLDITHEALIRNWKRLNQWALNEYNFYSTWIDFQKHLQRWIEHGRSSDFLLPIGPLTFFENWYEQCRPNPGWIMRYSDNENATRLQDAEKLLSESTLYLKRSARKAIVSRTFMKYGTKKLAAFVGIVIMVVLSGFYWLDAERKRNERVIDRLASRAAELVTSDEVDKTVKANYLLVQERYSDGTLISSLEQLPAAKTRISVAIESYVNLLLIDNHTQLPVKSRLIAFIEKELQNFAATGKDPAFLLREINQYLNTVVYDNYYNPQTDFDHRAAVISGLGYNIAMQFYSDHKLFEQSISTEINIAIQWWLTLQKQASLPAIEALLKAASPFEKTGDSTFRVYYAKGNTEANGNRNMEFAGGYHMLASLYASTGDTEKVFQCFETSASLPEYFTGRLFNNYNNIVGYFYQYGHKEKIPQLLEWLQRKYPTELKPQDVYKNVLNRSGYLSRMYFINFTRASRTHRGAMHMNLYLMPRDLFTEIARDYEAILSRLPDVSSKNFLLAMHYKRLAMFTHKYAFDRGFEPDIVTLNMWMQKAWEHFDKVDAKFLETVVTSPVPYWTDGIRHRPITTRNLFLYPDYMDGWFSRTYHSDLFYKYAADKGLIEKHYSSVADLDYLHFWLAKANELSPNREAMKYDNFYPMDDQTLLSLADVLTRKGSDANLPFVILANRHFQRSDTAQALLYAGKIDLETVKSSANRFEYLEQTFFMNQVKDLLCHLITVDKKNATSRLANIFTSNEHKAWIYLSYAEKLLNANSDPDAFVFLDSALQKMQQQNFSTIHADLNYKPKLIKLLGQIGGEKLNAISAGIVMNFREGEKFAGILEQVRGNAAEGNYFSAASAMPSTFTERQELVVYYSLLQESCKARDKLTGNADWALMDKSYAWEEQYVFFIPF
jgi:hypothetical protein